MIKSKFLLSAVPFMAVGSLFSLTACSKTYDLIIYNWEDYIYEGADETGRIVEDGTVKSFEKFYKEKYGKSIHVAYETFSTNEDMYAQLKLGAIKPDLICPSDYMIQKMANDGMLQPFSYDEASDTYGESLSNWADYGSPFIHDRFASAKLNNGQSFLNYAVPYFWGTMGFTYDVNYFSEKAPSVDLNSWSCLLTDVSAVPGAKEVFTLKDSVRDTYAAGIFLAYKDEIAALEPYFNDDDYNDKLSAIFNRCDAEAISKVETILKGVIGKTVLGLEVDTGKTDIVNGEIKANLAWSGDSVASMDNAEGKLQLNYALPKEGSNVWFDGWCMPKDARKEIAEEFVNFICSPEQAALCMDAVGYTSPIVGEDIWELVNDWYSADEGVEADDVDLSFYFGDSIEGEAVISVPTSERGRQFDAQYPTEEALKRCCIMKDFGDQQEEVDKMWNRIFA